MELSAAMMDGPSQSVYCSQFCSAAKGTVQRWPRDERGREGRKRERERREREDGGKELIGSCYFTLQVFGCSVVDKGREKERGREK